VTAQVKVLLVEDSSVLAERVADVIMQIPEIDLIGVVDSEDAALAEIRKRHVHVVLLDLYLKQGTGFGILRAISAMDKKPRVVVLTNHDSAEYERDATALGAAYFLDKARNFHRLPELLHEFVSSGSMD
jgi:two-component system, OmpR family, response regulator